MSDAGLTLRRLYWRATRLFPEKEIRSYDGASRTAYTYGTYADRVEALAAGLSRLGVTRGDRVGTIAWNHHRHFEAFFAVPMMGAQLHTINANLPAEKVRYVVNDAADDVLLVEPGDALDTVEALWPELESVEAVVVLADEVPETDVEPVYAYDHLLDAATDGGAAADRGAPADARAAGKGFEWPELPEDHAAAMCYTSGSTGRPKGAEYTQKMLYAQSLMLMGSAGANVAESDVVMPVVPMFHVNSWMLPYAAAVAGATQVYPGSKPTTERLARVIEDESVTVTHGVPTVWIDLADYVDDHDVDLSSLERIVTGGSALPKDLMRRFDEHGVTVEHTWGMTETMSLACASRPKSTMDDWDAADVVEQRTKQGLMSPGYEFKVVDDDGDEVAWDGESTGELWIRGPTVVDEYYDRPDATAEDFEDGWLKTGDVVTVDEHGYVHIVDRKKNLIKSGGEWISSIELEHALMAHEGVVEAAVFAVSHDRWQERPFACVKRKPSSDVTAEELRDHLADDHPRWWLPDDIEFVECVPKNATGKFDKLRLAGEYDGADLRWTPTR